MLARDDVAVLVLLISAAWLAGWILVSRWENTNHTEARRRELEAEREARGPPAGRAHSPGGSGNSVRVRGSSWSRSYS